MIDTWEECVAAIKALPDDEQMVMSLRYEHGMHLPEIAAAMSRHLYQVEYLHTSALRKCQPRLE